VAFAASRDELGRPPREGSGARGAGVGAGVTIWRASRYCSGARVQRRTTGVSSMTAGRVGLARASTRPAAF
jgi:hypothetical protein